MADKIMRDKIAVLKSPAVSSNRYTAEGVTQDGLEHLEVIWTLEHNIQ